jgi:fumarate reductase flavoprotein subunit
MKFDYDGIVVGGGGSGLAAAVSAAEHGANVLLLEKRPQLGGTTGMAVGSFTAAGTRAQQAAGIDDNAGDHAQDAALFAPPPIEARNHEDLRRFFLSHAAETLHWLMDMEVPFHGPHPEPPNRVRRMHNVVPNGKAYIERLESRLRQLGGTILTEALVEELLHDSTGVRGVAANLNGTRRQFHAHCGVVLAAGDYAASAELIARFKGPQFSGIESINPHSTGEGHVLAERVGARLVNMDITYGPEIRFIAGAGQAWQHPEDALFRDGAILINLRGERFCDETRSPEREVALATRPEKSCFVLLDQRLIERYSRWPHFVSTAPQIAYAYVADFLRLRPDIAVETSSLEELAGRRGLPAEVLRSTLAAYNAEAVRQNRPPLQGSRWVLLGPAKPYFTTTEGGAAINKEFQVLDQADRPIPGLYAVGQNGLGGQILWGHGLHIAWAITSGRLVGRQLANLRQA